MDPAAPRRRQARGARRVEQILDAAGVVFARVGFRAATTNAIAAEAGISPGSLYQFFSNKEAIAQELERRYAEELHRAHDAAADAGGSSLHDRIGRLVDVVVQYNIATPAFGALFAERPMPDELVASSRDLHELIVAELEAMLLPRTAIAAPERSRLIRVSVHVCRALMPLIVAAESAERAALVDDLKAVLGAYLGGTGARRPRDAAAAERPRPKS